MQMFVFQSSISISGSIWLIWLKVLPFWLKGWQTRSPQLVYTVQHVKQSNSIQYTCLYSIQFILSNMSNSPLCNTVQHCPTCQTVQPTNLQCPQRESQPNLTTYNNRDLFPYYYYYPAIFIHNILHHLWEYFGIYPEKNHNKNWDKDHFDNTTKGGPHGNMIRAILEICKTNYISDNWEQQSQHPWCNLFC